MLCFGSKPFSSSFLLILLSLLLCSTFFTFSHGSSNVQNLQPTRAFPELVEEREQNGFVPWVRRRSLAETGNSSELILAEKGTYRKDPTDGFKRYTGGWNISNQHYWASVGFTAVPLFFIAAIWFVAFGLCLSLICLCYCCCSREPYGYSRTAYALALIFLIVFTIAAIAGCVVLYTGQGKFHTSTTDTLDYVVHKASTTVDNLRSVSGYLSAAKKVGVDQVTLADNIQSNIDNIQKKINTSANTLSERTKKNSRDIQQVLDDVRLALIVLAAVMLFLAFLGFLFSILGMQCLVYFLVIIGWILVAGTFILCGVFLLLHNVVADTCVAMDEWVQNPTAHTALDDILPCVDNATAQETLLRSKDVTFQIVNMVNSAISNVSNANVPPNVGPPLYFNQSGPLMPILCNPFNSGLTNRQCAAGEVEMNNATEVWKNYICQASASGICTTPGRVTHDIYGQIAAAVNVSYGLYHYGPFLVSLQDCTFVRETFTDISGEYCPGLRRYSQWIYVGLVMVSAAVMLSLIFWVIYARERRHRVYTKRLTGGHSGGHFDKAP
ncbi:uncharacterized protein LOC131157883 [Malania oleifera]|uniref:uncharacterized protein LOC131157883 n=1 Tax=Malania oleifera TaxID=397392 RepID=UPI0025AE14E5|nr:uncharacterized protein LOC131157883 [Malania oleifera]